VLTNSRGVFDGAIAEYVLGLIIAFAKGFPETMALKEQRIWQHRLAERIAARRVLVVGVGGIGRAIARLLHGAGMEVQGVGRSERGSDPDFGLVHAQSELDRLLPEADFVVVAAPLTERTAGLFGARQFRAMKPAARFINVGRGAIADQDALVAALAEKQIAGAALDVFEQEPLPPQSPLWEMPSVIVSPHMSGDFAGYHEALAKLFSDNFRRFRSGASLRNVVDKELGYVPGDLQHSAQKSAPGADAGSFSHSK
jgi:phosphoglycerate dehydrogenase-like enzyme